MINKLIYVVEGPGVQKAPGYFFANQYTKCAQPHEMVTHQLRSRPPIGSNTLIKPDHSQYPQ